MKKTDVKVGQDCLVKVGGNWVAAKIAGELDGGGWEAKTAQSGKTIRVKSPERIRELPANAKKAGTKKAAPAQKPGKRIMTLAEYEGQDGADESTLPSAGRKVSLLKAAETVLADAGGPMTVKEIIEQAVATNAWAPGKGKTPENTLSASLRREIKAKGKDSRFALVGRGQFVFVKPS